MYDVLAPVRHVHSWQGSVRYAAELATLLNGSLTGLYAHEPLSILPDHAGGMSLTDAVQFLRELLDTATHAGPEFVRWAGEIGVAHSQWRVGQGSLRLLLSATAPWHDLMVIGLDQQRTWESPGGLAELLLGLQQPGIVVPPDVEHVELDTIVMAWNGTSESIRAIRSARPLLQRARRRILLQASTPSATPPLVLEQVSQHLVRHGLDHEVLALDTPSDRAGEAILHEATASGADLLVMGAYGRSRFSEWILGGATRTVLTQARLPVFFQH